MSESSRDLEEKLMESDKALREWLSEPKNQGLKDRYKHSKQELVNSVLNLRQALSGFTKSK